MQITSSKPLGATQRKGPLSSPLRVASACAGLLAVAGSCIPAARAADFTKPTAEELSMTSLPGYPGTPAVVLYREELTKDDLHSMQHYERIKVLTEEGKRYANVELPYVSTGGNWISGDDKSVDDIAGRTIHPDGTVIPFTGKPYLKVIEKGDGYKVQEKVFTLPNVEVGSIIEYRYAVRIADNFFESPTWRIQDDVLVKEAHFAWWPTTRQLVDEDEKPINAITWFPILPAGAKIESHLAGASSPGQGTSNMYEIRVKDIPPRVKEEHMPPLDSFSYGVHFAFTPYTTQQEYWRATGKQWSKRVNTFAGPDGALKDATQKVVAGASTPEEKLRKIYATTMALENTRFTREHDKREDQAAGLGQIKGAADVLKRERGTPDQIAEVFVGMARAAGLNASAMLVPDRSQRFFTPYWQQIGQLDDVIAIVNVDGKDQFFDPGERYCPYGHLAWQHSLVQGIRQTDGNNTAIGDTPGESYKNNRTTRVANLTMASNGEITGKIDLGFSGSAALHWRQVALRGDEEGLRKDLREAAEAMLPKTLEVQVTDIKDLKEYDHTLAVTYKVTGALGHQVGKRVMLPADIFLANQVASFPHEKREQAVDMHYPWIDQDAVRINLPPEYAVEAVPSPAKYTMSAGGAYGMQVEKAANSITTRRDLIVGGVIILSKDYPDLRKFYTQFESNDQAAVVLKSASTTTASN